MKKQKETAKKEFTEAMLSDEDKKSFLEVKTRIEQLKLSRQNHFGVNLDTLWADADRDYIPHRLGTSGKKIIATDEEKGWRGSIVNLGADDWQSDVSQANPFVKIQTALSILVDQNPSGTFTAANRKYQATSDLMKQLYQRSWEYAQSKAQLKLYVHNLAKYGWACARTYPLRVVRTSKILKKIDQENPENNVYETKEVVEYNDIMRENLDPRNVWIDEMTKPNKKFSMRDWCFRKIYDIDVAAKEFGKYKNWQYVHEGGNLDEVVNLKTSNFSNEADKPKKNQVEIYFYENVVKDLYMVIANGVPVVIEPLPISDVKGIKKLSIWQTYWNIRHAESPYGIGIYEAIRYDQGILDRFRNMTIDQITLSIYKMFFYQGTNNLSDTGEIKIKPGVGKQVLDPKNLTWLDVPGPGKDSFLGQEMVRKDLDEASGITDPLTSQITGKTAFEIGQAKESALKRLKSPLENILDSLNEEGYITISLIQLIYSIPEVYEISDPGLIEDYIKEIQGDPSLYERSQDLDENGNPQDKFKALVYPEFPLNLDKDEKGNLIETQDTRFFRVKPGALEWEGVISIKAQSVLTPSKQVEKALDLEMYNLLIPLMQNLAAERAMIGQTGQPANLDDLTTGKIAKAIVKLYDKDPRDIFPDAWLKTQPTPLFTPIQQPGTDQGANPGQAPAFPIQGPKRLVSNTQPPAEPQGMANQIMNKMTQGAKL